MRRRNLKETRNAERGTRNLPFIVQRSSSIVFLYRRLSACLCGLFFLLLISLFLSSDKVGLPTRGFPPFLQKVSAADLKDEIEKALYTRQEFFGAEAIVPLPTAVARENLAQLAENFPGNAEILFKLAELNEKLGKFDEAEANLNRLAETDAARLENLAAFYKRRAQFEKEALVLRKILLTAAAENRAAVFEKLVDLARLHDLQEYLKPEFYAEVARENPNILEIFQKLAEKLDEEKNYAEALKFLRAAKAQFPGAQSVLLEKEIEILLETNQAREAENVYHAAFNPLWSREEAEKFYDFLSNRDRLRAYGAELKAKFRQNPADFDAGLRLALYRQHDYEYGNDRITPIITKLESAKKIWTTEEMVIAARLLLRENESQTASRFLYTLLAREDFRAGSNFRAQILYQLFEIFSDAENQKLPLTKGDLRFYADVAQIDRSPGIATGILSLIFSDARPQKTLDQQESSAMTYFNRAAAYRIFQEYKKEFPASPELAQMYLDVVRLYTATKETEIAEKALNEFAERYADSSDYPATALKLADAFAATEQPEKAREVYRKLLDYLGKQKKSLAPQRTFNGGFSNAANTQTFEISPSRNDGINIPKPQATPKPDYYYSPNESVFRDYMARETGEITYAEVLEKLVAPLAGERKTSEILELYSAEIAKYPDEEWLYERRLEWLEKTSFAEEELKVYRTALARFQTRGWQDKLARWFLRQKRNDDFAAFSEDLAGKLNDAEIQSYLAQFVDGNVSASEFEKQLYLKLYQTAHRRFPHNIAFVKGLLNFYKTNRRRDDWQRLCAEYYFEASEIREAFLDDLAEKGELRSHLQKASGESTIYELFRADVSVRLSNYENAIAAYRKLNANYPNAPEFSARLVNFTRSFGQKNRELLTEAARLAKSQADFLPASAEYRTQSGEIFAELGSYETAREEWEKLPATAKGDREIYLDAATVYWDYFQYDDALRTIKTLREKFADETLYAFEAGAILEAQHKPEQAVSEYVKALGARDETEDATQKYKAKKRLANLFARETDEKNIGKSDFGQWVETAYSSRSGQSPNASFLALGYAEFLVEINQSAKAENVLNRAIAPSRDAEFLEAAKDFYASEEIKAGEQFALKRLAETSDSPRRKIAYHLQLAESFEQNGERDKAKSILTQLVKRFPTNFGVLTETSDFYWRLGFENESIGLLQNVLPRSRGAYRTRLAQKLSKRLVQSDRLDAAEQILSRLHDEEKSDTEIFRELAGIYVRAGKPEALRKIFNETVAALKQNASGQQPYLDMEIAALRAQMIDAFTRLGDYQSAIEQHIEIINREPENEELTENAVAYVQRYGGAQTLLNYYLKTSAEAFKNYRWNVVLARIYEAHKDWENASKNYRAAIDNQPEMIELYVSLADVETARNNFDEAVRNLDAVLELTNDEAQYVKKKIEILKKAGRLREIEAEKAKLPVEEEKKSAPFDQFAEAQKLQNTEKEAARRLYREAFEKLLENPLSGELKASDITAYVQSVREEEPLNQINERLWQLREKLFAARAQDNSTETGEAQRRLSTLDGAITEAVGDIAKSVATDEELAALHADLKRRIEDVSLASDRHQTVWLVQDLSRRAGFGDLEETILLKKSDELTIDKQTHLQNLLSFYNERGAYEKAFDALEKYGSDNSALKAETARLAGNREKELEALRRIYWKTEKIGVSNDADVARYLEILYGENREELKSLTEKSSAFQLQLVNFLLGRGEREMAHAAIENANLAAAWKISRHAETSLALKEFDETAECYFCDALQFDLIGNLIEQKPDRKRFLVNDDWFRLTREYGEWLAEKTNRQAIENQPKDAESGKYLPAMIENQPRSAAEQAKLGDFYLEKNQPEKAIEHFRLAAEIDAGDVTSWSKLGAAYRAAGEKDWARECWEKALEGKGIGNGPAHFRALQKYDLSGAARENLPPVIIEFLQTADAGDSEDFQNLIRLIAASFNDETEKASYFRRILKERPTDTSLAEMLVGESLIEKNRQNEFYELLIARSAGLSDYDYDYNFASVLQRVWIDAESVYEQENDYQTEQPESERFERQKKYLEFLGAQRENAKAGQLIAEIEKSLKRRYARPAWLRLAKIRIEIREGKFDRAEAERFTGITVSDAVTEIKLPSVERFNDVLRILREEKREAEAMQLAEAFFARNLALEQFGAANFAGLSRIFFQKGEAEKAVRLLQLMIDAGNETKKETARAEIAALDVVKMRGADRTKPANSETVDLNSSNALPLLAAEIAAEFQQAESAITFRRRLLETNPLNSANRIELAKLLAAGGEKQEADALLRQIIDDRNSARAARWQARALLSENGAQVEFTNAEFDAFSQFYRGLYAARNAQNETATVFFINSLIADKDAETFARRQLIKSYALSNQPSAALKFAATDKSPKPDELLQTLSEAAEKIGDFGKAIEFEKGKAALNAERIRHLQNLDNEQNRRATDLTVDLENTRKL